NNISDDSPLIVFVPYNMKPLSGVSRMVVTTSSPDPPISRFQSRLPVASTFTNRISLPPFPTVGVVVIAQASTNPSLVAATASPWSKLLDVVLSSSLKILLLRINSSPSIYRALPGTILMSLLMRKKYAFAFSPLVSEYVPIAQYPTG